jgi:hypothetical protein
MLRWTIPLMVILAGCADSAAPEPVDTFSDDFEENLVATSTTGVIRGVIVDNAILPVLGVTVKILALAKETMTNDAGAFGFSNLDPGTYFLEISKPGYNTTQSSATVVAGEAKPPIVKIQITPNPTTQPYVESTTLAGHLACGAAGFYTSVGCSINSALSGF